MERADIRMVVELVERGKGALISIYFSDFPYCLVLQATHRGWQLGKRSNL